MQTSVILLLAPAILVSLISVGRCETVCCEGLPRCFNDDAPYDHLPLPSCQETVQVSFDLYTRRNPSEGVAVLPDLPLPYVYDGGKRTAFVIHGFQSSSSGSWVVDMKDGLLAKEDMNVILVDWSEGASNLWYPQPAANIRTTGAMVGKVSNQLIQEGGSAPARLWCIGASLGAHSCGQAGRYVTFQRVTGLDPAGPLFENYDISTGLNPRSGSYVEAIHSAGRGGLIGFNPGTLKPLAHVDFYPNGGEVQPGCDNYYAQEEMVSRPRIPEALKMLYAEATPYLACSHKRANLYFIESLTSRCHMYAWQQCTDSNNIPGSCKSCGNRPCNELGYDSEKAVNHQGARGLMYLETNSEEPFCKG